ncbi:MAG: DUF1858 domain-containing protein [Deltaproteobacteria bacterium]
MPDTISGNMTTGEVTTKWPTTKEVFVKHFGAGCFSCPAFGTEPISMACAMHSTDMDTFVSELKEAAKRDEASR